jgi:hypothetical protein
MKSNAAVEPADALRIFVPPPPQKSILDKTVSAEIIRERLSAFLQCIPFERFELPVASENVFALHQFSLLHRQVPTTNAKMVEEARQSLTEQNSETPHERNPVRPSPPSFLLLCSFRPFFLPPFLPSFVPSLRSFLEILP